MNRRAFLSNCTGAMAGIGGGSCIVCRQAILHGKQAQRGVTRSLRNLASRPILETALIGAGSLNSPDHTTSPASKL